MASPDDTNCAAIQRLEGLLDELRSNASTARETEAIREIGFEIAIAIREVGALLSDAGREQALVANRRSVRGDGGTGL
jgi:hypothetical protein